MLDRLKNDTPEYGPGCSGDGSLKLALGGAVLGLSAIASAARTATRAVLLAAGSMLLFAGSMLLAARAAIAAIAAAFSAAASAIDMGEFVYFKITHSITLLCDNLPD